MRPHSDSCRKLVLLRGWLCGIPEWNNSQERVPQHGCLPQPTTHPLVAVAVAICLLCRISWAANCFFFISSSRSSIRSSHSILGSSSGPKCHSNSLLRFILPLIRQRKTLAKAGAGAGGQWQMRVSTAIVARVCARKEDLLRRRARFLVLGLGSGWHVAGSK